MGLTTKELFEKIAEKSLVDVDALPKKARIVWFSKMQAMEVSLLYPLTEAGEKGDPKRQEMLNSLYPTTWLRGGRSPFNPDMLILEMFEDESEFRIDAAPSADAKPRLKEGKPVPLAPTVYRLSKTANVMSQDAASYEMIIDLVANEWAMVDEGISTRDRERALILDYIETLDPDYSVKQLAQDIIDEEHYLEEDDEDEDDAEETEETDEPKAPPPPAGLAAAPPAAAPPEPPPPPVPSAAASESLSE